MKSITLKTVGFFLLFTLICGVVYTAVITGAAQIIFPIQANGSIIEVGGKEYGSKLLGQKFTGENHLWGRPVSIDVSTYKDEDGKVLAYAAPSNLSPASEEYAQLIADRVEKIRDAHPEQGEIPVPVELVTESGSGLDPHISVMAAQYQIERIAKSNNIEQTDVEKIIRECTTGKFLGILGEENVNVLEVNLMLDGVLKNS